MEFDAILSASYDDCGYPSSPAADVVTRFKRYVNEGLQAILAEPSLFGLIEASTPYPFSSVANQPLYTLPEGYTILRTLRDTTNDRTLEAMSLAQYRRADSHPSNNTGTPQNYVPIGHVAVALQPSDASELFVKSTSASDTGTAYLSGVTSGGYRRTASVSVNGTSAVSFSASITDWVEITDVYMSAVAVGTVKILEDSGSGTELARISIGQYRPNYLGFYLWPTPSSVITYVADVRRELDLLVQTKDEPPMPRDFHPMLIAYATYREWERKDDSRSAIARQQYESWLSRLKYRLAASGDSIPVARSRQGVGRSRLGPYFPADTVTRW